MKQCFVGLRDGEKPVTVMIGDFEFVFGITEFRNLLSLAAMDLPASFSIGLHKPIRQILSYIDSEIPQCKRSTPEEDEANLQRYHETGSGGRHDLSTLVVAMEERRERKRRGACCCNDPSLPVSCPQHGGELSDTA